MAKHRTFTDQLVTDIEHLPGWIWPVFMLPIVLGIVVAILLTRGSDQFV